MRTTHERTRLVGLLVERIAAGQPVEFVIFATREVVNNVIDGEVTRGARRLTDFDSPGVAGSSRERESKAVRRYYLPSFSFFHLFSPSPSFFFPFPFPLPERRV